MRANPKKSPARPAWREPAPRVAAKWRWHFRVLLDLRDRLLQERAARLRAAAEPLEPHSMDQADSATDEFDHDRALSELSAEQDSLYEVDEALQRIMGGTYGVCEETGEPIPAARLKAVPWTRFSRQSEARLERTGQVSRPRLGTLGSVRGAATGDLEDSALPEEERVHPAPEEIAIRQFAEQELSSAPRKAAHTRKAR